MSERPLPHDIIAEQSALGAALISRRALTDISFLRPADFYRPAHQVIYSVMCAMADRGDAVDAITVNVELVKLGEAVRVGGAVYLHTLTEAPTNVASAGYYAKAVADRAFFRGLVEAGTRVTQLGHEGEGERDAIADHALSTLERAVAVSETTELCSLDDIMPAAFDRLERPLDTSTNVGLPWADLQALTGGLRSGQLVVVAGRPGMGKTTLMLGAARHAAIAQRLPTLVCSLEMSQDELMHRVLSAEARVPLHLVIQHRLGDEEWMRLSAARARMSGSPLFIDDTANVTVAHLRARLRAMARTTPARLVVLDYLQLMTSAARAESRQQEVAEISRSLKLLAKEFHVPIILGAQLNRGPELRSDKRPVVSDLRESGAVEQDCDMALLLYREEVHDPETPRAGEVDIIVGKHRNGPTATVTVAWQGQYARMWDMATG
ncbi:replicative DNA helicase [Nocardiopsis synnemataformans]|uniref:replicative DNA helicase n=1 Tax=Nocardiopsis synnemataformans TaxID=61305 RepID=UPI003EB7F0A1